MSLVLITDSISTSTIRSSSKFRVDRPRTFLRGLLILRTNVPQKTFPPRGLSKDEMPVNSLVASKFVRSCNLAYFCAQRLERFGVIRCKTCGYSLRLLHSSKCTARVEAHVNKHMPTFFDSFRSTSGLLVSVDSGPTKLRPNMRKRRIFGYSFVKQIVRRLRAVRHAFVFATHYTFSNNFFTASCPRSSQKRSLIVVRGISYSTVLDRFV